MQRLKNTLSLLILSTLLLSQLSFAKDIDKSQLYGSWKIDINAMIEAIINTSAPSERAQMESMRDFFAASMSGDAIFTEDTVKMTITIMGQTETVTGSYTVIEQTTNSLKLRIVEANNPSTTATIITFLSNEKISMQDEGAPKGEKVILIR